MSRCRKSFLYSRRLFLPKERMLSVTDRKGQGIVELALLLPLFLSLIFILIYSGLVFMDYLHYSNATREIAREIAVLDKDQRQGKVDSLSNEGALIHYVNPNTKLFHASPDIQLIQSDNHTGTSSASENPGRVTVSIELSFIDRNSIPIPIAVLRDSFADAFLKPITITYTIF